MKSLIFARKSGQFFFALFNVPETFCAVARISGGVMFLLYV